jgi:hypothetical protein
VWVGLGGFDTDATSLEQIGTYANCAGAGRAAYGAWLELLPNSSSHIRMDIRPGDVMSASVTIRHHHVTLRVSDETTRTRASITRHAKAVDVSSAEWIVEAPSTCEANACEPLQLANFGSVAFSNATATAKGRTAPAGDREWLTTELELQQSSHALGVTTAATGGDDLPAQELISARPTRVSSSTGGFAVEWREQDTGG